MTRKRSDQHSAAPIANITPVNTDGVTFEPCGDFLLLELVRADQTAGGVLIPEQFQASRFPRWRVLSVGPGRRYSDGSVHPIRCKPGNEVIVSPECGRVIGIEGRSQQTILASEDTILAVVHAPEAGPRLVEAS